MCVFKIIKQQRPSNIIFLKENDCHMFKVKKEYVHIILKNTEKRLGRLWMDRINIELIIPGDVIR